MTAFSCHAIPGFWQDGTHTHPRTMSSTAAAIPLSATTYLFHRHHDHNMNSKQQNIILITNFRHFQPALWGLLPHTTAWWPQDTTFLPHLLLICLPALSLPMPYFSSTDRSPFHNGCWSRIRRTTSHSPSHFTCLHTPDCLTAVNILMMRRRERLFFTHPTI